MKYFLILFSVLVFGQHIPLAIKINSIVANDSLSTKRRYQINYQIENKTNNEVRFFLKPNTFIAQAASSLTLFTVYKMYRNGVFDAMDGPFYEKMYAEHDAINDLDSTKKEALILKITERLKTTKKAYLENYQRNGGTSTDENWIYKNQNLLQAAITLKPNEIKKYTIEASWRRNRYFKIEDSEFYLDEKDKFEIQLALILNKSDRAEALSKTEYLAIKNDPNFIEGTFLSNITAISFN